MQTPIYDFISAAAQRKPVRFFMPGHKGKAVLEGHPLASVHPYDLTEIEGADALFEAAGIIGESEQNAAALFGARDTLYSTGGSTLCIQTMLALAARRGSKIIAGRNAHMAFIHACVLLRLEPIWLLPPTVDACGICGAVTAEQVETALREQPDAAAVYVTSPDYLGNTAPLAEIAALCKQAGIPLLCDNAHGAYLKFTQSGAHPLEQGVTMCCDSAHKTLPVLTGGAYLHLNQDCPFDKAQAKAAMNLFGSTSPSYLILLSLDLCNRYLEERAQADFAALAVRVQELRTLLTRKKIGFFPNAVDFAKLTLEANRIGLTGTHLQAMLAEQGMECEYANEQFMVLMLSPFHEELEWERLVRFLEALPIDTPLESAACPYELPPVVCAPWEAYWKPSRTVSSEQAVGYIAAQTLSACPPGVPLVMPGEVVTKQIKNISENGGNLVWKVLE